MPRKTIVTLGTLEVTYKNGEKRTFAQGLVREGEVAAVNLKLRGRSIPDQRGQERPAGSQIKLACYRLREGQTGLTPLAAITLKAAEVASLKVINTVQVEITR